MKRILTLFTLASYLSIVTLSAQSVELSKQIERDFLQLNTAAIASYALPITDVSLLGKSGKYNQDQLELLLADFLGSDRPKSCQLAYASDKKSIGFLIYDFEGSQKYRVHVLYTNRNNKKKIKQIRIDEAD